MVPHQDKWHKLKALVLDFRILPHHQACFYNLRSKMNSCDGLVIMYLPTSEQIVRNMLCDRPGWEAICILQISLIISVKNADVATSTS